jgi:glycosyltransferase involved in cell wall biosynthesis
VRIRRFLGDHAIELPIGIDTALFNPGESPVRSLLGWTKQHRVVGYVGQLTHLKGVDLLAAAFRDMCPNAPMARLLIVGSGAEARFIRSTLSRELNRGIVHIEPDVPHDQLPNWYRAMDLLVLPSRYENYSNALLEAMGCGIPFLASDVGGNKQVATSGGGWLFEPESVTSLSFYLGKLFLNHTELRTRGQFGYRHIRNYYSWARTAAQLENIIQSRLRIPA